MSYFYTKVPTQWSPNADYELSDDIILRPADRTNFSYLPAILNVPHDTLFFISISPDVDDHKDKLKQWIIFHSFLFKFSQLSYLFERGDLRTHRRESSLNHIRESSPDLSNAYITNFDDIASSIYHPEQLTEQITYKSLYEVFVNLNDENKAFIINYLLEFNQRYMKIGYTDLFSLHKKYWQIVVYVTLLDAIIGHPPICESRTSCDICGRNLFPHRDLRQGSETAWRMTYLTNLGIDQQTREDYANAINAAYQEIRHPTAHAPISPTAQYILQETPLEIYDIARSIRELSTNATALDNLLWSIKDITRFLLLNKIFRLNIFPRLRPLQSARIGW
jgi:hypothetical protein